MKSPQLSFTKSLKKLQNKLLLQGLIDYPTTTPALHPCNTIEPSCAIARSQKDLRHLTGVELSQKYSHLQDFLSKKLDQLTQQLEEAEESNFELIEMQQTYETQREEFQKQQEQKLAALQEQHKQEIAALRSQTLYLWLIAIALVIAVVAKTMLT